MPEASKSENKAAESKAKETSANYDIEEFEWLQYQDPGDPQDRIASKLLQNPFVPLGALATVTALTLGLYNLRKQNQVKQQFYMRARVGAQGFTIASLIGGLFYQSHKKEAENQERLQARMQQKKNQDSSKEKSKS